MFGKKESDCAPVVVHTVRPTFALTSRGVFHHVDHFIYLFREGEPVRSFFVSSKGACQRSDQFVKIFSSPLSRDEYNHLRSLGETWKTFTMEYFDQQCRDFGIEVYER